MSIRKWIDAMLGRTQTDHDQEARVILDDAEGRMAGRLSTLTGRRRDEVLAESYRRADKILAERRK
jgi:hypothetical protein